MITIKEELVRDASSKLRRAIKLGGHEAVTLWLALKAYAASNPTDGFIPDEEIEELCRGLIRHRSKAMKALVDCGKLKGSDGRRGAGLVDPVPLGWQLHDYLDHAASGDEEAVRRQKDKERKQLHRRRASLIKLLVKQGYGLNEAEGKVRQLKRDQVETMIASMEEPEPETSADVTRDSHADTGRDGDTDVSSGHPDVTLARGRARDHAGPCDPQPNPAQPSPTKVNNTPLPPKLGDPTRLARDRDDVRQLHEAWKRMTGLTGHSIRTMYGYNDASALASAIDEHGLDQCLLVVKHAKRDGMVSGRDDDGKKHESIGYIFGNTQTFARILRDADKAERQSGSKSAEELYERAISR